MKHDTTFGEMMRVRAPAGLVDAIDKIATRELATRSSYVRRAVIEKLRTDGVTIEEFLAA